MLKNILLTVCCAALSVSALDATADPLDTQLQTAIQHYLQQYQSAYHLSSVQLSVILPNGSAPRDNITGMQYYEGPTAQIRIPATTQMMMQWGSITKEYTSMLVFKLANEGDFNVTDTLGKLFYTQHFQPGVADPWPAQWENVSLVQLMNMTSGIPSYTIDTTLDPTKQYSMAALTDIAAEQTTQGCTLAQGCFPAGETYYYSNTNYIILGLLVEQYTRESFSNAINHYILDPFKAQQPSNQASSVDYLAGVYPENIFVQMIHGYAFYQDAWADVTPFNMSWAASAGAMLGNMDTLARLTQALYSNQLVVPAGQLEQYPVQMSNGQPATDATQCGTGCYAMGIALLYQANQGGMIWLYQGETLGYNTVYLWIPSENVIIAVSQNGAPQGKSPLVNFALQLNNDVRAYLKMPTSSVDLKSPSSYA